MLKKSGERGAQAGGACSRGLHEERDDRDARAAHGNLLSSGMVIRCARVREGAGADGTARPRPTRLHRALEVAGLAGGEDRGARAAASLTELDAGVQALGAHGYLPPSRNLPPSRIRPPSGLRTLG